MKKERLVMSENVNVYDITREIGILHLFFIVPLALRAATCYVVLMTTTPITLDTFRELDDLLFEVESAKTALVDAKQACTEANNAVLSAKAALALAQANAAKAKATYTLALHACPAARERYQEHRDAMRLQGFNV